MARSEKTKVIQYIFQQLWDEETQTLVRDVVNFDDIWDAIDATGAKLSKGNPANFLKDVVRSPSRNTIFPAYVVERGYTAEQYVGDRQSFRFVPLPLGRTTAFSDYAPPEDAVANPHLIESLSLSIAARRLGRRDESWLTQVSVRLHVLHTHLALYSSRNIAALDLLQTTVKLGGSEIDAVFLAHEPISDREFSDILIACEMKGAREVFEWEQLERGALAIRDFGRHELKNPELEVIPMAIKIVAGQKLWVMEFAHDFPPLELASEHVYAFKPEVKGIY